MIFLTQLSLAIVSHSLAIASSLPESPGVVVQPSTVQWSSEGKNTGLGSL
ncbi:hypothetical protein GLYMA_14G097050v4 [Glycine max]|nr:hypothetical protein GLYMA_14G097050v4 [Glycine max]KAH1093865.1 hypothetical protein GYH30_039543 [Glycine max]